MAAPVIGTVTLLIAKFPIQTARTAYGAKRHREKSREYIIMCTDIGICTFGIIQMLGKPNHMYHLKRKQCYFDPGLHDNINVCQLTILAQIPTDSRWAATVPAHRVTGGTILTLTAEEAVPAKCAL
jgi:hypothetical protein